MHKPNKPNKHDRISWVSSNTIGDTGSYSHYSHYSESCSYWMSLYYGRYRDSDSSPAECNSQIVLNSIVLAMPDSLTLRLLELRWVSRLKKIVSSFFVFYRNTLEIHCIYSVFNSIVSSMNFIHSMNFISTIFWRLITKRLSSKFEESIFLLVRSKA